MPIKTTCKLLATTLAALLTVSCSEKQAASPANVILLIGDGMDEHQITMARNYLHGPEGALAMEKMPVRSSVTVQTLREDDTSRFRFVADSANTATTLATGQLTSVGRISTTAAENQAVETILEQAQTAGYRTGLVSTASLTDATPAAFATHVSNRGCQSPNHMGYPGATQTCESDLKINGGAGSIVEQLATADVDVLLGGGMAAFSETMPGEIGITMLDITQRHGHQLSTNAKELDATNTSPKLLGLFANKHLPTEWIGENNRKAERLTVDNKGEAVYPAPINCVPNPRHKGVPTLPQMTGSALAALSRSNDKGFFLMVEGASIDKQAHKRNPCAQIGELQAFDKAVELTRKFAAQNPNTLVIVTADHGQAGQIVPLPEIYQLYSKIYRQAQFSEGLYAVLNTLKGESLAVNLRHQFIARWRNGRAYRNECSGIYARPKPKRCPRADQPAHYQPIDASAPWGFS